MSFWTITGEIKLTASNFTLFEALAAIKSGQIRRLDTFSEPTRIAALIAVNPRLMQLFTSFLSGVKVGNIGVFTIQHLAAA